MTRQIKPGLVAL